MFKNRTIGIHRLVQSPVGNFNRDDMGQPKSSVLGGVNRAVWSSQAFKRDARNRFALGGVFSDRLRGVRTVDVAKAITAHVVENGMSDRSEEEVLASAREYLESLFKSKSMAAKEEKYKKAVQAVSEAEAKVSELDEADSKMDKAVATLNKAIAARDKASEALSSGALVYLSKPAIAAAAADMVNPDTPNAPSQTDLIDLLGGSISLDAAAFGRMYAADKSRSPQSLNTDATVQVSFSVSTGAFSPDVDFYTALDDATGVVASMGHSFTGAPIMYTYMAVNVDALANTLGEDVTSDEFRDILTLLVTSLVSAAPTGKENGSGSVPPPSTVLFTVGDTPTILTSAFVEPCDTLSESAERLQTALSAYSKGYGLEYSTQAVFSLDTADTVSGVRRYDVLAEALEAAVEDATGEV